MPNAYEQTEPGKNKPRVSSAYPQTSGGAGARRDPYTWNPTSQQQQNVARDTWSAYKNNGADGGWIGGAGNPYQIRGAAGDNGMTDFYYRNAGDTGQGQKYGALSSGAWENNQNHPEWQASEATNFYNSAGGQFGDWWGNSQGWDQGNAAQNPDPIAPPGPPAQTYTPPTPVTPTTGDVAADYGFGAGKQLLEQAMLDKREMPAWWGDNYQMQNPEEWANKYPGQVFNPTLNSVEMPDNYQAQEYQGMMNGDYNRLESSLRQPGEIAARTAYDQGSRDLKNYMGSTGMYGSSVMGQQANEGINREFMNTNATNAANAASQRYGLQQSDLQFGDQANRQDRQFGANFGLQRADLDRQQNIDKWKAGVTDAGLERDYNNQRFMFDYANSDAARQERNELNKGQYDYQMQADAWQQALREGLANQASQLTGNATQLSSAEMRYQQSRDLAAQRSNSARWGLGADVVGRIFGVGSGGYQGSLGQSLLSSIGIGGR